MYKWLCQGANVLASGAGPVTGRLPFHAPSHDFFLHMIEEIHDRNASLSIYQKKFLFTSMCGLQ
jgi:hypothetical protein